MINFGSSNKIMHSKLLIFLYLRFFIYIRHIIVCMFLHHTLTTEILPLFFQKMPGFGFALRSRTELLLGVVYEVCRDECFCAWRGGRAFMNGEEIHVSGVRDIKDAFVDIQNANIR